MEASQWITGVCRLMQVHEIIEHGRDIFDMFGHHMGHAGLSLDAPRDAQEAARDHRAAVGLVELLPHDHVAGAEFILKRDEDHTLCGAGALAHEDQPRHRDPRALGREVQQVVRQALGRFGPIGGVGAGFHEGTKIEHERVGARGRIRGVFVLERRARAYYLGRDLDFHA